MLNKIYVRKVLQLCKVGTTVQLPAALQEETEFVFGGVKHSASEEHFETQYPEFKSQVFEE